jgi:ferric-dicitrate binding protein FerR (iron transport regulator)
MKETDDILRRIANNEATEEEMRVADEYLQSLSQRLSSQIDDWEKEEVDARSHPSRRVWLRTALTAAACLLLLFSVALWFDRPDDTTAAAMVQKDSFDDPEEAAAEAEQALLKFSEVINKATCYNTK